MDHIKAVVFDVDNTLVNRKAAFLRFCDYLIDHYANDYPYLGAREELIGKMIEADDNGYGGKSNFIPRLQNIWKLQVTTEEFIAQRNSIFGKLSVPMESVYEVLDTLKGRYKLGIITNGYSSVQREKITTVGITDYFDDIIISGEVDFEKPDPRIFRMSCENLRVKPEEMVFIGDYYPNDIAGAIGAKIMPIWITQDPDEHSDYSGIRITHLKELLQLL
jgi:putative hydrolase of the HAD superfamily